MGPAVGPHLAASSSSCGGGGIITQRPRKRPRTIRASSVARHQVLGGASGSASSSSGPRVLPGRLRAVLFDFDATLTCREELQLWRLFPERSGFGSQLDMGWLREKGFGGEARIQSLGRMLAALASRGAELHVVSFADREVVVRALAILGALHFFCDRIVGWQELGGLTGDACKASFIKELMVTRRWRRDEVLFVDDQEQNIRSAEGLCLTHLTRGRGLSIEEMEYIVSKSLPDVPRSQPSDNSSSERSDSVPGTPPSAAGDGGQGTPPSAVGDGSQGGGADAQSTLE